VFASAEASAGLSDGAGKGRERFVRIMPRIIGCIEPSSAA
jgi:hypothetical protein